MDKVSFFTEVKPVVKCIKCHGDFTHAYYLADEDKYVCSECYRKLNGYRESKTGLVLSDDLGTMIRNEIPNQKMSAWYLFGEMEVKKGVKTIKCDKALRWGQNRYGYPVFDSRANAQELFNMAKDSKCLVTLFSIPRLSDPPRPENLAYLRRTNTPYVCLMDCNAENIYTCELRNSSCLIPSVIPKTKKAVV